MASGWLFSLSLLGVGAALGAGARHVLGRVARRGAPSGAVAGDPAPREESQLSAAAEERSAELEGWRRPARRDAAARLAERVSGDARARAQLQRALRDAADVLGAEEAIYWEWDPVRDRLAPRSWTGEPVSRPTRFHMADWGPLVQWAAEGRMVQCEGDGEHPAMAAAPILLDDQLAGVLSVTREGGLQTDRAEVRSWLPRHAAQLAVILELAAVRQRLARHDWRFEELSLAIDKLQRGGVESAPRTLCDVALDITGANFAAVVRWDGPSATGTVEFAHPGLGIAPGLGVEEESLVGTACENMQPLTWEDATVLDRRVRLCGPGEKFDGAGSLALVPLRRGDGVLGALIVADDVPGTISTSEAHLLQLLEPSAASALEASWKLREKATQLEEAEEAANRDRLTGLWNRRYFDEQMKRKTAEALRYSKPLSLIVLDVDHFKRVNDTYGHETGDAVLQHVAAILGEGARAADVCARFGGEEIAILSTETREQGALDLAERLRRSIEQRPLALPAGEVRVTASFGVSTFPETVSHPDELFPAADQALYEAKRSGRNQVRWAKASDRAIRR